MKTYSGSLQRRGNRYYLVIHKNHRQKWFALKTGKLPIARMRAARLAPADPNSEEAWLQMLVREGERARVKLARRKARREIAWENLDEHCLRVVDVGASDERRLCHAHWICLLVRVVKSCRIPSAPGSLTGSEARRIVQCLGETHLSVWRMTTYYRRVWRLLGLNAAIWPRQGEQDVFCKKSSEHYRRLSVDEVRQIYRWLLKKGDANLAEMVLIGYSTGLRLSDVAELELAEISLPFLRVCPNKTRRRKPRPLKIPLTDEAQKVVARLKDAAERGRASFLFSNLVRRRPSRRLAAAFSLAGVAKIGGGRASFHSLRATFISLMDDAGISPHVTDSITGHVGGGMHSRYTQPSDGALLDAVARAIPPIGTSQPAL